METEYTVVDTATPEQWEALRRDECSENITITDEGVELSREEIPTYVAPASVGRESLASIRPIDVDVDRTGARYVLGADGSLYRAGPTEESFTRLECDDLAAREATPEALCITGDVLYVVGTRPGEGGADGDRGYVQTLLLPLRQTRWVLEQVDGEPLDEPIRVVRRRSADGVFVLDCGRRFVAQVNDDGTAHTVVSGLCNPRDITVDDGGDLVVLDAKEDGGTDTWVLRRFPVPADASSPERSRGDGETARGRGQTGDDSTGEEGQKGGGEEPQPSKPLLEDVSCVEAVGGGVFVVGVKTGTTGEQMLYRYVATDEPVATLSREAVEPFSSFRQGCTRLRRGDEDAEPPLYAIDDDRSIDDDRRDVWVLEPAKAVERWETNGIDDGEGDAIAADDCWGGEYGGRFVGRFDLASIGAERGRVHLEYGDVPPGTQVVLRYATTNRDIAECDWDGRCDVECRCGRDDQCTNGWEPVEASNPSDELLSLCGHRFLWLGLELHGSQFDSPTIRSLKLSITHRSYVHYLPTIYREAGPSATFLERFLSVFEDTFGDIDDAITTLTRYFDPETVPSPYLSWLGGWLAIAEDEAWSVESKRRFIDEAPTLFKQRGTRQGLLRLLEIYLGGEAESPTPWMTVRDSARIADGREGGGGSADRDADRDVDHFVSLLEYRDVTAGPGSTNLTEVETESLAPFRDLLCCPQEFVVLVGPTVGENAQRTVERIVESERPAHTLGRTVSLRSEERLGDHVYLGVNSYLPPREFVVGGSRLGRDSVVDDPSLDSLLGQMSRLGTDLELT